MAANLQDALSAIATVQTDVTTLAAQVAANSQPVDLQPVVDAVNALDTAVKAISATLPATA